MATKPSKVVKLHKSLEMFQVLSKKRGLNFEEDTVNAQGGIQCTSTGSTPLNLLIGGNRMPNGNFVCPGWPSGRISEIYGREGSGKSTVALTAMGQVVNSGGTGLYLDQEHAVVDQYALKLGCDFRSIEQGGTGRAIRVSASTAEEVEAYLLAAALSGINFIVVDSVAAMVPRKEAERNAADEEDKNQIALLPRLMSNLLPKVQGIISKSGTHVMFLNQVREKIGAMGYTEEAKTTTPGGNALKFYASLRIFLKAKEVSKAKRKNPLTGENDEIPISTNVLAKNIKNKIDALQGFTSMFTIRYGVGIDEIRSIINIGVAYKIVQMSKNAKKQEVYSFASNETGQVIECIGVEKFRSELNSIKNREIYKELEKMCHEAVIRASRPLEDEDIDKLEEDAITKSVADKDDDDDHIDHGELIQEQEPTEEVAGPSEEDILG